MPSNSISSQRSVEGAKHLRRSLSGAAPPTRHAHPFRLLFVIGATEKIIHSESSTWDQISLSVLSITRLP
jgi:hypothetical protein